MAETKRLWNRLITPPENQNINRARAGVRGSEETRPRSSAPSCALLLENVQEGSELEKLSYASGVSESSRALVPISVCHTWCWLEQRVKNCSPREGLALGRLLDCLPREGPHGGAGEECEESEEEGAAEMGDDLTTYLPPPRLGFGRGEVEKWGAK